MKNQSNIHRKWLKNPPKIDLGGVLGPLGASWGRLGVFGGVLKVSWGRLGPSWSEKGGQHGSNLAPKTEPKSFKNRSQNRSILESLLGVDFKRILMYFGSKMEPSWNPNGIQNLSQLRTTTFWKKCLSWGKTMILKVLGIEVGSQNPTKIDQKSISSWEGLLMSIFIDFAGFWKPRWNQVGRENR